MASVPGSDRICGQPARLTLPWPPANNRYYRHPNSGPLAGRSLISSEGRIYHKLVADLALIHRWPRFGDTARLRVFIHVLPPDRRRRDLDGMVKAPLDALQKAGIYGDDSQIDILLITRNRDEFGGVLKIEISKLLF